MALLDSFDGTSGTELSAYNPLWERLSGDTGTFLITSAGRVRRGTSTTTVTYSYSGFTPATADYEVEANYTVLTTDKVERIGITARTSTSSRTFYTARFAINNASATFAIMEANSAAPALLGTAYSTTVTAGQVVKLKLSVSGSTLKLYVDDVERVSVTDSTITAAGRVGLYYASDSSTTSGTQGIHINDISVYEADPGRLVTLNTSLDSATSSSQTAVDSVATSTVNVGGVSVSSGSLVDVSISGTLNYLSTSVTSGAGLEVSANTSKTLDGVSIVAFASGSNGRSLDLVKTLSDTSVNCLATSVISVQSLPTLSGVSLSTNSTLANGVSLNRTLANVQLSSTVTGTIPTSTCDLTKVLDSTEIASQINLTIDANSIKTLSGVGINATAVFGDANELVLSSTLSDTTVRSFTTLTGQPRRVKRRTIQFKHSGMISIFR